MNDVLEIPPVKIPVKEGCPFGIPCHVDSAEGFFVLSWYYSVWSAKHHENGRMVSHYKKGSPEAIGRFSEDIDRFDLSVYDIVSYVPSSNEDSDNEPHASLCNHIAKRHRLIDGGGWIQRHMTIQCAAKAVYQGQPRPTATQHYESLHVDSAHVGAFRKRKVLLLDDVITTGAAFNGVKRLLRELKYPPQCIHGVMLSKTARKRVIPFARAFLDQGDHLENVPF